MMRPEIQGILISVAVALAAAVLFMAVATLAGGYTWFERGGGALWLTFLVALAAMPLVIPAMRRRSRRPQAAG
jgi:hypothetical protein